jgi:hypothetical protein
MGGIDLTLRAADEEWTLTCNNGICLLLHTSLCPPFCVESLKRVEEITGKKPTFYKVDLLDRDALKKVFDQVCVYGCMGVPCALKTKRTCASGLDLFMPRYHLLSTVAALLRSCQGCNPLCTRATSHHRSAHSTRFPVSFTLLVSRPWASRRRSPSCTTTTTSRAPLSSSKSCTYVIDGMQVPVVWLAHACPHC